MVQLKTHYFYGSRISFLIKDRTISKCGEHIHALLDIFFNDVNKLTVVVTPAGEYFG